MSFTRKVYVIRHNITNRIYVGSSGNVDRRFRAHISALRRGEHKVEDMQADFDKYGEDYTFTIVDVIDRYEDRVKEYEWMKKYQSHIRGIGYNYKDSALHHIPKSPKHLLTFNEKTMPIKDWAILVGIPYGVIYDRVYSRNWDVAKALTTPVGRQGGRHDK